MKGAGTIVINAAIAIENCFIFFSWIDLGYHELRFAKTPASIFNGLYLHHPVSANLELIIHCNDGHPIAFVG
jgi:hypothetical protein